MLLALLLAAAAVTTEPPEILYIPGPGGPLVCRREGHLLICQVWEPPRPYVRFPGESCPQFRARSSDPSIRCPEDRPSR